MLGSGGVAGWMSRVSFIQSLALSAKHFTNIFSDNLVIFFCYFRPDLSENNAIWLFYRMVLTLPRAAVQWPYTTDN